MRPVTVIENTSGLLDLAGELERSRFIAIDTESNSFYAYFERICLIQISTEENDYVVDPLTVEDMQPLGSVLTNPAIEKIFHAASNDITGLKRDYQFNICNLFDTALASKMLGDRQLGLAAILERHFGVHLDKKLQRHNWGKRPLTEEQINYARLDTHYLIPLRHQLAERLEMRDLSEKARESFHKACAQELPEKVFQPKGFLRLHGAHTLDQVGKNVLKRLYLYREKEARRRDRAPFRILSNEVLVRIAFCRPTSIKEFSKIKGVPKFFRKGRAAFELVEMIRRTQEESIEVQVVEGIPVVTSDDYSGGQL